MTIQEAAKRLSKSESTVRRWIREAKLTATKVKGVWNIPDELVNDYLNNQSTGGSMEGAIQQLRTENQYLKERIQELESARERSDTIMLQLTRQNQQLLEDKRPFWQRWFRKGRDTGE